MNPKEQSMRAILVAVIAILTACSGSDATNPLPLIPLPPSAPPVVGSISIEGAPTMTVAESQSLRVVLFDIAGNVVSGKVVAFTSSNPDIASVDASGLVKALTEGSVTITVRSEGASATKIVTVRPRLPCEGQPTDCTVAGERYVLILVDDIPLPVKSPWGAGEWDYDDDAGTWMLTEAVITLFPDGVFAYRTSHRAASGATSADISVGRYARGEDSIRFAANGMSWRSETSANRMIERWLNGKTLTFER